MARYQSFQGDPYWIVARYPGKCAKCGEAFAKGADIVWYPRQKRAYADHCAAAAWADFEAMAEAEYVLGGGRF